MTQATNWNNAASAVANLKQTGLLEDSRDSFRALLELGQAELEERIRSSGYFRQKAARLRRLIEFLDKNLGPPPWRISPEETSTWRTRLLGIKGLGPETVDSILLYGFGLPCFVVDAYTRRILTRHEMIEANALYDDIRLMFEKAFPERSDVYNEYHALIVRLGKEHCRSDPCCTNCPLLS
ncbi:hypothetical protein JXM67_12215 [candidate division WOR-3 bacterium]|nr:hypothetical protein [candidate division WOR-3 bacterium]